MADGIQVLRYNIGQAYIAHTDFFPPGTSDDHNWDSTDGGTNRLATLFLYLSDVEEGGQTVFPHADPPTGANATSLLERNIIQGEHNSKKTSEAASGLFKEHSWQKTMVDQCYSKLAILPRKGNAILFYSQGPGGKLDDESLHGGCPVLSGQKWAANLWVWNGPRFGQPGAPGPNTQQGTRLLRVPEALTTARSR